MKKFILKNLYSFSFAFSRKAYGKVGINVIFVCFPKNT